MNISTNIQQVINLQDARFIKDLAKSLMILIIISIAEEQHFDNDNHFHLILL